MIIVIMNEKALHDITYGLYLIGSRSGERDGARISNTVIQAANSPNRIAVSLNKSNYTTELILDGGQFSVSIISQSAPFELFKRFGFQSGRNVDKFAGADYVERAEGGIYGLKNIAYPAYWRKLQTLQTWEAIYCLRPTFSTAIF